MGGSASVPEKVAGVWNASGPGSIGQLYVDKTGGMTEMWRSGNMSSSSNCAPLKQWDEAANTGETGCVCCPCCCRKPVIYTAAQGDRPETLQVGDVTWTNKQPYQDPQMNRH